MINARLASDYQAALDHGEPLVAAEYAYALGKLNLAAGDLESARSFAIKCLELLENQQTGTVENVTPEHSTLGGISIPDYFHAGVVTTRLLREVLVVD